MLFLRRVPFAFCSLLLWHSLTRERVKGVLRHALNNPGSRPGKSPLRGPFALCRLPFGSGPSLHSCRPSPPPASLRAAPVSRQRLIDFHAGPTASLRFSAFQINSFRFEQQFRRPDKRSAIRHDITEFQTQLPDGGINTLSGLRFCRFVFSSFRRPDKRSAIRHDITEFQLHLPDGGINTLSGLRFCRFVFSSFRRPDKRSAIRHDITEFQLQLPDGGINTLSGLRFCRFVFSSFRRPDKRSAIRHDIAEFQLHLPDGGINALSGLRFRRFVVSSFHRFVGLISVAPSGMTSLSFRRNFRMAA